jgi:hypothetical protein
VAAAIVLITYFWRRRRAEMDEPPPMIIAIHSRRPRVRPAPHSDEDTRPLRRAA